MVHLREKAFSTVKVAPSKSREVFSRNHIRPIELRGERQGVGLW